MGLKVSKNIVLPRIDRIRDPETRIVLQQLIKSIQDMNSVYYNDLTYLYKEGEWTPTVEFGGNSVGISYAIRGGLYTKVGRKVTITGRITLSSKGTSTGIAQLTGLPFTSKNAYGASGAVSLFFVNIKFANVFQGIVEPNTKIITLGETTENGAYTTLTNSDFANDSYIFMSATYFTD